ncbi:MAG: hypothetical protein EPN88_05810 [Bacteroidetes bacterium]|nr:MAG: hypothetical protein EPN88_05810 [Bacteroidota bacterium]
MIKIKVTNEVGGKKAISFGIVAVSFLMLILLILIIINPESSNLIGLIGTIILTGVTAIVLFLTLQTYIEILRVSEQTLSFTKTQTSFNIFFENFKYFDDLSKRIIPFISDGGLYEMEKHFENMSIDSIHFKFINILKQFPTETNDMRYEISFRRLMSKIQPFIDLLYNEIIKIINSNNLTTEQKINLINLYRIFILSDYSNLCHDVSQNKEMFDSNILPPTEISDLLKCNRKRINLDPVAFLKLYYEIEKPIS